MESSATHGPPCGEPGRSAQAAYETRLRNREVRARRRLGGLGVALARLSGEPASIASWRKGAAAERRLAARLHQMLDRRGVELLHDRLLDEHGKANIDHLAIGPGGVTVIDAKSSSGPVRVERYGLLLRRERLRIGGRDRTRFIEKLEEQVTAVEEALEAAGLEEVDTTGALCMVDPSGLPLFGRLRVGGLAVGGPKSIGRLAARGGELTDNEIKAIARELAACFPEA